MPALRRSSGLTSISYCDAARRLKVSVARSRNLPGTNHSETQALIDVSARLARDPLLVQAGSGNTSVKLDGVLWIEASSKWLAHAAQEEILVPVDLVEIKSCIQRKTNFVAQYTSPSGHRLVPSIETAMHAVVPRAATIHVHWVRAQGRTGSLLAAVEEMEKNLGRKPQQIVVDEGTLLATAWKPWRQRKSKCSDRSPIRKSVRPPR